MVESGSKRVEFYVPDMACSHCTRAISEALGKAGGVVNTEIDLPSKTVTVDYDPARVNMDDLKRVLADAGYPPQGGSEG